jgi:hypothetical protein
LEAVIWSAIRVIDASILGRLAAASAAPFTAKQVV